MIRIRVEQLTKRFGDVLALDDVTLDIAPGELFFLLGPSGCGKTTLLRHVAGFYQPDHGRIFFGDKDVTQTPPHRRNTGMMFQSYALWPHKTVSGNVAFGLEERKIPRAEVRQRVRDALESVRMGEYGDRRIGQLSGGQQQRVALARALVIRPTCLLLDEPLSNLDARLRLEMRNEIRRVCKEFGLTAIYVTHDQKEALSVSDRMAIMDSGRIAQVGSPQDVYRRPRTRLVADFIGESNFLDGVVEATVDGATLVATAYGEFLGYPSDSAWHSKPGAEVTLSIRPEALTIVDSVPPRNVIAGTIAESVYLGEVAQYRFRARPLQSDGQEMALKVFELNPRHIAQVGDRLSHAAVQPEDVVILPR